jgi:pilus assembly protein Flp/PilA
MVPYDEYFLSRAGIVLSDEEGQGLVEYVLIAALISIAAIAVMRTLGPQISGVFTSVGTELPTAP